MNQEGAGGDGFGVNEMYLALLAGTDPATLVLNGSNKQTEELEMAIQNSLCINIDATDELARIEEIFQRLGLVADIGIRPKLDLDPLRDQAGVAMHGPGTMKQQSDSTKWGMSCDQTVAIVKAAQASSWLRLKETHFHLSRMSNDPASFAVAAREVVTWSGYLRDERRSSGYRCRNSVLSRVALCPARPAWRSAPWARSSRASGRMGQYGPVDEPPVLGRGARLVLSCRPRHRRRSRAVGTGRSGRSAVQFRRGWQPPTDAAARARRLRRLSRRRWIYGILRGAVQCVASAGVGPGVGKPCRNHHRARAAEGRCRALPGSAAPACRLLRAQPPERTGRRMTCLRAYAAWI
jgi:hypothetical protein